VIVKVEHAIKIGRAALQRAGLKERRIFASSIHFCECGEVTPYFLFYPTRASGSLFRMGGALGISVPELDHYADAQASDFSLPSLQAHTANFWRPFFDEWLDINDAESVDAWAVEIRDELLRWPASVETLGAAIGQDSIGGKSVDTFPTVLTPEGLQRFRRFITWCDAKGMPTKHLVSAIAFAEPQISN
jgi:hypothetical protein